MKRKEIQASTWNPPAEMRRIATERTRDITRAWLSRAAWDNCNFMILAESAYMQGINDAVDALHQRGLVIQPPSEPEVWEGYCG